MTDEIRKLLHGVPFVPFVLKTFHGKQYRVKHPDYVAISPKDGRITLFDDEETTATLTTLHIVGVQLQRARSRR